MKKSILRKLRSIVGEKYCTDSDIVLVCYSYDATALRYMPDAVVFPGTTDEVAAVMRLANEERFPVIPRGAGTGMTGGALAIQGGVVMGMTRMNRVLRIDAENMVAEAEPGVITGDFQKLVESKGLFYPPDPASASYATLGGNVAECAGGVRAVKYGVTKDYVLGLSVVLPTGDCLRTGVETAKGVAGYDVTRLIVGSEGTLGIITKIILRLLTLPETVCTMTAAFDHLEDATQTVSVMMQSGITPRTLEYMDQAAIRCAESYLNIGLPTDIGALLLIETDGPQETAEMEISRLCTLCLSHGARSVRKAKTPQEAIDLWKARRAISPALFRLHPDKINEDIVVPRNKIPHLVKKINILRNETGLTMVSFGHAGDGNIHFNIMLDKRKKADLEKANAAVEALLKYAVALGGTISGEHGIGITKRPYLRLEMSEAEIGLMKRIKKAFDPNNILNPGKVFD
jgi:glycolate oxidase